MKTMGCGMMSLARERDIKSGKCKAFSMPSYSKFVVNYEKYGLTHVSLPDNFAVEITGTRQYERLNRVTGKTIKYVEFNLGSITTRTEADTIYQRFTGHKDTHPADTASCILKKEIVWNNRRFYQDQQMWYKISSHETVYGKRYLIFFGNSFQAGMYKEEFDRLFEVPQ